MKTDTGKIIGRKFISGPLFQTEKKSRREQIPLPENEIQPKNRHCLRGLDGKYGRWDVILRDILNGKLKTTETDTEEEDDEDDEEMPATTERETYDTSERNGSYVPIRTNPEDDALQLHTDGEIPGGNKSNNISRRSYRNIVKPNTYGSVPYTGNFWGYLKLKYVCYRNIVEPT